MKILAAQFVLPISSDFIENGAVAIKGNRIAGVGNRSEIEAEFSGCDTEDLGEAVIMPGLVNCHSHLEITALRNALDDVEHDFRSWLLKLNSLRSELTANDIEAAAVSGALEGAQAGVTCFGDIGRFAGAGMAALKTVGLRGTIYQETEFSPDNRTADTDFVALTSKFEDLRSQETELVRAGLSPHSPYTVGSQLFEVIAQYSILNKVPITIHAAESASEMELLTKGAGFFTEVYDKFGFEWHSPHSTPIEYLDRIGVLAAQPLLAHCVFVNEEDIKRIAGAGAKVAHCPKSNAKFGHGYAPVESMINSGITIGLGSDSVASNNICDLFEESRFASLAARNRVGSSRFITSGEILEIATLGGAKALGLESKIGTIEQGKDADLAVVSLSSIRQKPINDVNAALVFSTCAADVLITLVAGKEVYRRASA